VDANGHVSDRKFVDQSAGEEELVKADGGENVVAAAEATVAPATA
jgi:hypothetical protein